MLNLVSEKRLTDHLKVEMVLDVFNNVLYSYFKEFNNYSHSIVPGGLDV